METPQISRSGRVLKKSAKVKEMEDFDITDLDMQGRPRKKSLDEDDKRVAPIKIPKLSLNLVGGQQQKRMPSKGSPIKKQFVMDESSGDGSKESDSSSVSSDSSSTSSSSDDSDSEEMRQRFSNVEVKQPQEKVIVEPYRQSNVEIISCKQEDGIYNSQADGSLTEESNNINTSSDILTSTLKQGDPPFKKRKLDSERQEFPIIKEGFIHEALQNNYNGTLAILEYSKSGCLSPHSQQLVAECVLLYEIKGDIEKKLTASRFTELAEKIKEYFPSESTFTYYIPYYKDRDNKKHSASGKLPDLLYRIRRKATKSGIREKPTKPFEDITSEGDPTDCEEKRNLVNSLKLSCSPWQEYLQKWELTHEYRMFQLRKIITDRSLQEESKVSTFLKEFKGLKEPLGYTLLELDYALMYPGTENNLLGYWPYFKRNLVDALNFLLKGRQFSEDDSDAKLLLNFSALVKPKMLVDKLSNKWKPTREVIQEGFMMHVTSPLDLDSCIKRFRERAAARNETVKPVAVVVGSIDKVTDAYVVFDSFYYHLDSPVKALDVTFKTYHAIHAEYPKHAEPLWLIIQSAVYGIKTEWDNMKALKTIESTVNKLSVIR